MIHSVPRRIARKGGALVEVRFSAAPIYEDGRVNSFCGIFEDMTERRLIEQQLVHAQKMEAIGNFTGGMAHDFNNILGIIIGNLDLLHAQLGSASPLRELAG